MTIIAPVFLYRALYLIIKNNSHPSLRLVPLHKLDHLGHILQLELGHVRLNLMLGREFNCLLHVVACCTVDVSLGPII